LEGLEISEVKFSEMLSMSRFDSEYFRPLFIKLQKRLEILPHTTLGAKSCFVAGPFGSEFHVENYEEQSGFRYIRGKDVKSFFVENGDNVYIPGNDYTRLSDHSVKTDDVLISVVGTLGNACIATSDDLPAIFSCKSTIIRKPEVNPYYLVSFLNSAPGKTLLLRNARGTVQLGLNLPDLRQLLIPLFSKNFQAVTESTIRKAQTCLCDSKSSFTQAEQTLIRALGLENWQPPEPLTYTRRASDAFTAGRLDAEHFHPKFDAMLTTVRNTGLDLIELGEVILPVKNGFDHRDFVEEGTSYIRVGDIGRNRINLDSAKKIAIKANEIVKNIGLNIGDVLFTRKGSFGNAAHVRQGEEHAIISSEIMLIRRKNDWKERLLPEYLAMFFNSQMGQQQAERWAHGAAFYSVSQDDLEGFLLPILPINQQEKIKSLVNSGESFRRQAHALLDAAKRAVEIAIEHNEQAALAYLAAFDRETC